MHTINWICAWKCGEHMKNQHISVQPWASDFMEIHPNILKSIFSLKNQKISTKLHKLNKYDCPTLAGKMDYLFKKTPQNN